MARSDAKETKKRILHVSEQLFSQNGYEGTGVDLIAKSAEVNKALIYYHFQSKQGLLNALTATITTELREHISQSLHPRQDEDAPDHFQAQMSKMLVYLISKRDLLKIIVMESLKSGGSMLLFECADLVINRGKGNIHDEMLAHGHLKSDDDAFLMHEFFTGFIPVISFVVFQEKYCAYYKTDPKKALDLFIEVFGKAHMAAHFEV